MFGMNFGVLSADYDSIDPDQVVVERVRTDVMVDYQQSLSRAIWRPAPGRKLAFLVRHDAGLLGLIFLASPVVNLGPRDKFLKLPADPSEKGLALRGYADLSVCVSVQPAGWRWNLGKMMALIATTLGDYWTDAYGDELLGIVTTSLWGKGSQYNRIYKFLGYTAGYGHEHIPNHDYRRMMAEMRIGNQAIPSSRFGTGANPRMRRIAAYRKWSGNRDVTLFHGNKRGIYYHAAQAPASRTEVIRAWYSRWGEPRYLRLANEVSPYQNGLATVPEGDTTR
jgi:hypothetical protein